MASFFVFFFFFFLFCFCMWNLKKVGSSTTFNPCMRSPICVHAACSSDRVLPAGSKQQVTAWPRLQTPSSREGGQNTGRKLEPFGEWLQFVVISANKIVILSMTGPKIGYNFGERRKAFILLLGSFPAPRLRSAFQHNKLCRQCTAANAQPGGN